MRNHISEYWRHRESGEIWAVGYSLDPDRDVYRVIEGACGPLYHEEINEDCLRTQMEWDDADVEWFAEHEDEFALYELVRDDGSIFSRHSVSTSSSSHALS